MENSSASPISRAWPTYWDPEAFRPGLTLLAGLGLVLALFVLTVAIVVAYIVVHHGAFPIPPPIRFTLGTQLVFDLAALVYLAILVPRLAKRSLRDLGFVVPKWSQVGIAVLGAIAMVLVVDGLASLIDTIAHTKHQQDVVKLFLQINTPGLKMFMAFFAAVIAPICEEFAFRVFVFNAGLKYWGFWGAALLSGLLFGLAHTDLYTLVPLILGGMILCGVYYRTRNAWMSMITHGIFNAVSVVGLFVSKPPIHP